MPKMGESITEGTVIQWHKKPGDVVEPDETLLEIGTDKVDTEVPSPEGGILSEILVQEGETVEVGTALAILETDVEAAGESAPREPEGAAEEEAEVAAEAKASAAEADTADAEEGTDVGEIEEEAVAEDDQVQASDSEQVEPHLEIRSRGGGEIEVVMPKMGESITEGTVIAWHKKVGDTVEQDETLLEIGTDKVDTEVPSPASGVLKQILVQENETVEVGTPVAILATEVEEGAQPAAESGPTESAERPAAKPAPERPRREKAAAKQPATEGVETHAGDGAVAEPVGAGKISRKGSDGRFYSPLVRSIAEKEGLTMQDLESISGSGHDGRVTKQDILNYIESGRRAEPRTAPAERREAPKRPTAPAADAAAVGDEHGGRVEIIEMDRMRQIIAEHMVRSKATSAHVTSFAEADVTGLVKLREAKKQEFEAREGVKLTFTPFFVHAAVEALREHPILNASVEEKRILIKKDLHIGIAVAIGKKGLVAPVIRDAGQKNLSGLAHAAADLAARARNKQLQPDELQGGTFTITNIGSLGSLMGTPIINQPQVAILAVGTIKKRPVVIEDPNLGDIIAVRQMVYLSLSYDHRIIDGAMAASFLQKYVATLEEIGPDFEL